MTKVYPNVSYHALRTTTPSFIGAPALWGPRLSSAGQGVKIGIIDDGVDRVHPYFTRERIQDAARVPERETNASRREGDRRPRLRAPGAEVEVRTAPFDPLNSEHATHVAGIAAGNYRTRAGRTRRVSGVAPKAYLGNYKVLTVPDGELRAERELGRDRRRHRGRGPRRDGRDQSLARRGGDRSEPRHRRRARSTAPRRRASCPSSQPATTSRSSAQGRSHRRAALRARSRPPQRARAGRSSRPSPPAGRRRCRCA